MKNRNLIMLIVLSMMFLNHFDSKAGEAVVIIDTISEAYVAYDYNAPLDGNYYIIMSNTDKSTSFRMTIKEAINYKIMSKSCESATNTTKNAERMIGIKAYPRGTKQFRKDEDVIGKTVRLQYDNTNISQKPSLKLYKIVNITEIKNSKDINEEGKGEPIKKKQKR